MTKVFFITLITGMSGEYQSGSRQQQELLRR